jgi:hypothetical protein
MKSEHDTRRRQWQPARGDGGGSRRTADSRRALQPTERKGPCSATLPAEALQRRAAATKCADCGREAAQRNRRRERELRWAHLEDLVEMRHGRPTRHLRGGERHGGSSAGRRERAGRLSVSAEKTSVVHGRGDTHARTPPSLALGLPQDRIRADSGSCRRSKAATRWDLCE